MTKNFLLMLSIATFALLACEKKDDNKVGVDDQGNCKVEFINAYNEVIQATLDLEAAYVPTPTDPATIQKKLFVLNSACTVMKQNYKGLTCNGRLMSNPDRSTAGVPITYESLRANCQTIQSNMAQKPGEKPFSGKESKEMVAPTVDPEFLVEN